MSLAHDITKYITPKPRGRVFITPAATQCLKEACEVERAEIKESALYACVGASLVDFLSSDFMRRSAWFKSQPLHTFTGVVFNDPDTLEPRSDVRLVVREMTGGAHAVCTPSECNLPENYFETRVIEETRVQYKELLK